LVASTAGGALAGAPTTWTGKVPIEGAISANQDAPRPGDVFLVYVNATPLRPGAGLSIRLLAPEGAEPVEGASLAESWPGGDAGATRSLVVPLRATAREGGIELRAHVALLAADGREEAARSFVLVLDPAPTAGRPAREGRSGSGEPLRIYPGTN
jgi:hypothetical protein